MSELENKIKLLPDHPGVYVMLGEGEKVIYVGKAKNLKNRVRQYFQSSAKSEKVTAMVKNIVDFYYILTYSENEAFTLENNLIKRYKPRYNILLKDDKTYPYLKINLKNPYPYFEVTRRVKKDGAKYFGPFMNGISVHEMLDVINSVYMLRSCDKKIGEKKGKECLNYHIKRCMAPCICACTQNEYMQNVKRALDYLNGASDDCRQILTDKMNYFAQAEEFEIAMGYRDKIKMLDSIDAKKITSLNKFINADVISYANNGIFSAVSVLVVRAGKMLGGRAISLDGAYVDDGEYLASFIKEYYLKEREVPDEILVNVSLEDAKFIEDYLKENTGKSVKIIHVIKGDKKTLSDMAYKNAADYLDRYVGKIKHKEDMTSIACAKLKDILKLKKYPYRMECYDISHTSGIEKVGSMVVFTDGQADKKEYRKFRIKEVEGNNDFASLQEVLKRRLDKIVQGDEHFPRPDLIIIDGGKGQLSSVKEIFDKYGFNDIELISLAKKEELIYTVYTNEPIILSHRDYCLKLLQRIRDEAHRFAITYHRSRREKRTLEGELAQIEGVGKKRANDLLKKFGSVKAIAEADERMLLETEGLGEKTARAILEYFLRKNH